MVLGWFLVVFGTTGSPSRVLGWFQGAHRSSVTLDGSGSYLFVEPAALYHRSVKISLDGVGPLAKVVDLFGGRAGRLRGQRRERTNDSDELKVFKSTMLTTIKIIPS